MPKAKTARSIPVATATRTKYSPWLSFDRYGAWCDRRGGYFCCNGRLREFFGLKSARNGWVVQIRFRVSSVSLGDDYEVHDGLSDLPTWAYLITSVKVEPVMLRLALGRLLYGGCWVGLESREVPNE
jgi:hypothetical protein